MSKILPKKKQLVLNFLKKFIIEHGYAPTLGDIAAHFKLSSNATVHEHLEYLEKHGFIKKTDGEIEVTPPSQKSFEEAYLEGSSFSLPIAGLITAGSPIEAVEDLPETSPVPASLAKRQDAYVLKVKGDSMIESFIDDGDFVIINKQEYANDGDIVVALLEDGTATLKEFHQERNYIRLQPRNPKYNPIKTKNVIIQGKVVGIIRQFN